MSIYVMTVGDLAKRRGEPVSDFVKKVQELGFNAGSHAKKLTQDDLNNIIGLLDGGVGATPTPKRQEAPAIKVENPNVVMVRLENGSTLVAFGDASVNEDGTITLKVVEKSVETGIGNTLLEFRKQLGTKLGVN